MIFRSVYWEVVTLPNVVRDVRTDLNLTDISLWMADDCTESHPYICQAEGMA